MKFLRCLGLVAVLAGLAAIVPAAASATELVNSSGMVTTGSTIAAETEGAVVFSNPFGSIECNGSSISAKTSTTGGSSETVKANVETLSFTSCSSTVTVLAKGTLEFHTQGGSPNGNGIVTSSGAEVTTVKLGLDCIYKTSNTQIGTLTGSTATGKTATYDIAATVPRTGGSSFCGPTGEWKGSYKVTTPDALNVDGPSPPAATTLTTSLSGEEKSGEEITVLEGAKVKDQATLSGEKASTATGTIKYFVYSDSKCEKLVTKAGETAFTEGKVPASEEKTLEAGAVYYWQAEYTGDSKNAASKSTCGKEVETVKATTSLSTSLSGEGKEGETITVLEGTKVKDQATLSGTKSSTATGTLKYKVYKDSECKELSTNAGEVTVNEGKSAASEEKTLAAAAIYYWQVEYGGDSLHKKSTSSCTEKATVKATTSLSTSLSGEVEESEEPVEGEEITVAEGFMVVDSATLGGTNAAEATGTVKYSVYSDNECEELVTEAGEGSVEAGEVPPSEEEEFEEGTYYWQVVYLGDALHAGTTSPCTEIAKVPATTSLETSLSGEDEESGEIAVTEGAAVSDTATLSGTNAAEATGMVKYFVYSDLYCEELVTEAGEVEVEGTEVPPSDEVELEETGDYYWQAEYSGDGANHASTSPCGSEAELVMPPITTTLSGEELSDAEIEVLEGAAVSDEATLNGEHAAEATGTVKYSVYSDSECEELVTEAGEVNVEGEHVPASTEETLPEGIYFWQAEYSGDEETPAATSVCGTEILKVVTATSLTTSLSGKGEEGEEIEVEEGSSVSDHATLSGANASTAEGIVEYSVYSDSECEELVALAGDGSVSEGTASPSEEQTLPAGTYYWQAEYSGDGVNHASTSTCGSEIEVVTAPITTTLSGEEQSGDEIEVPKGAAVSDEATLHGAHAAEATGTVKYSVYSDSECEELVTEAGEVNVEGEHVPASTEETLPEGIYFWQAEYSGDEKNPPATSACGSEQAAVADPDGKYAAVGDSFSSGEGIRTDGGSYYANTNRSGRLRTRSANRCHRSSEAWPALIADAIYKGKGVTVENTVFEQQPPLFIFRACSGAVAANLWGDPGDAKSAKAGQYDELIRAPKEKDKWLPTPAQHLWLTLPGGEFPGKANDKITAVTITIGGNDVGFAAIAKKCIQTPDFRDYDPKPCQVEIANNEIFNELGKRLSFLLKEVKKAAPNARIRVPLYPQPLELKAGVNVLVGNIVGGRGKLYFNNEVVGRDKLTVAQDLNRFVEKLNHTIAEAANKAFKKDGVPVSAVLAAEQAFDGHRLGDAVPWVDEVVKLHKEESFHPNRCGHKALAKAVLPTVKFGVDPPELCKP